MDTIVCRFCGEPIAWELFHLFAHVRCSPGKGPVALKAQAQAAAEEQRRQAEIKALHEKFQAREQALAEMRARQYGLGPMPRRPTDVGR